MNRLQGKVAIVTGAGTGLGHAIARLYAEEGARVIVADILDAAGEKTVEVIRNSGGEAIFVHTDVSQSDDVQGAVAAAEQEYGALHIMTANAGTLGRAGLKPFLDYTDQDFAEIQYVNLFGTFYCFRYAAPAILRAGGGSMTATGTAGYVHGYPRLASYIASKAGVVGLARAVAAEFGEAIRVNVVATGGGQQSQISIHSAELRGQGQPEQSRPIGHAGIRDTEAREGAAAHLFLVSDEASAISGAVITVDLGFHNMPVGWEHLTYAAGEGSMT